MACLSVKYETKEGLTSSFLYDISDDVAKKMTDEDIDYWLSEELPNIENFEWEYKQ